MTTATKEGLTMSRSEQSTCPIRMTSNKTQASFMNSLDFSDIEEQMATLKSALFDIAETNDTKIQFIKEELSAGRYQIYNHHVAEKLLQYTDLIVESEPA